MKKRSQLSLAWALFLIALPVVVGRQFPGLLNDTRALILGFALTTAMAALGLNVIMGYAGQISLGHAAFYGTGAYASAILTGRYGASFIAGALVATLAGALISYIIGLVSLRIRGLYLAISTLVFGVVAFDGFFKLPYLTGGSAGQDAPRPVAGEFIFLSNADYLALVVALTLAVWHLDFNLSATKIGRAFAAIRANEDMASTLGINVTRYKTLAFVVAGAFTGLAGAVYAPLASVVESSNFTFTDSLGFVLIVVVGGLGSRIGVFSAAVAFTIFPELVSRLNLSETEFLVGAVLFLYTLVRNPAGFAGTFRELKEKRVANAFKDKPMPVATLPRPKGEHVELTQDALVVNDLRVSFGGLNAVDGATFTVRANTITGLIGPNGAGKTTCLNAISGLVKPNGGSIEFNGTDITALESHGRAALGIGRTFQLLGLAPDLSVSQNLLLAQHRLANYHAAAGFVMPRNVFRIENELRETARETIDVLGFERYADAPMKNLSGGQQRLVELAAALVTSPSLLLLDEPSGGMAPNAIESLGARLKELRDDLGRTVVLIEHNIPLVMAVCDYVVVLAQGKVLAQGTPDEVVHNPAVVEAYLGRRPAGALR